MNRNCWFQKFSLAQYFIKWLKALLYGLSIEINSTTCHFVNVYLHDGNCYRNHLRKHLRYILRNKSCSLRSKWNGIYITWQQQMHYDLCKTFWGSWMFNNKYTFQYGCLSFQFCKILYLTLFLIAVHWGEATELSMWEFTEFIEQIKS